MILYAFSGSVIKVPLLSFVPFIYFRKRFEQDNFMPKSSTEMEYGRWGVDMSLGNHNSLTVYYSDSN